MNRFTENPRYPRNTPKLVIAIAEEEKREIEALAAIAGVTLSDWVRAAIKAAKRRRK